MKRTNSPIRQRKVRRMIVKMRAETLERLAGEYTSVAEEGIALAERLMLTPDAIPSREDVEMVANILERRRLLLEAMIPIASVETGAGMLEDLLSIEASQVVVAVALRDEGD